MRSWGVCFMTSSCVLQHGVLLVLRKPVLDGLRIEPQGCIAILPHFDVGKPFLIHHLPEFGAADIEPDHDLLTAQQLGRYSGFRFHCDALGCSWHGRVSFHFVALIGSLPFETGMSDEQVTVG